MTLKKFLSFFRPAPPIPHVCDFKCIGYGKHFGQVSELKEYIEHPNYYHYPSLEQTKVWINNGYVWASIFQSHWQCSCGKQLIYFFLDNPCVDYLNRKSIDTVSQKVYDEMVTHNPLKLNASRGHSLSEVTDELIRILLTK